MKLNISGSDEGAERGKNGPGPLNFIHCDYHLTHSPNVENDTFILSVDHVGIGNHNGIENKHRGNRAICTNADIGIGEREPRQTGRNNGQGRREIKYRNSEKNRTFQLICYVFLLGVFIAPSLFGVALAQTEYPPVYGWTIELDRPFAYVAGDINGTVRGPAGAFYQLQIVNTTTWQGWTIYNGNTSYGNDTFGINLKEELYKAGHFQLNVTVMGDTVAYTYLEIIYSDDYIHDKDHEWWRDWAGSFERMFNVLDKRVRSVIERLSMIEWFLFWILVCNIYFAQSHIYHSVIPRFRAWYEQNDRKGKHNRRSYGLSADPNVWHGKGHPRIPADRLPNTHEIAKNLYLLGVPKHTAECIVMDSTGDMGNGSYVKLLYSAYEKGQAFIKKKIKKVKK